MASANTISEVKPKHADESRGFLREGDVALFDAFLEKIKTLNTDSPPSTKEEAYALFDEIPEFSDLTVKERRDWMARTYAVIQRIENLEERG